MARHDGLIGVRRTALPAGAPTARRAVGVATVDPAVGASVALPVADQTRLLLEGPIGRTLLRLAAPNVVVMAVQAAVNAGEAYFLGWLGADALAGVSLVFPLIMLMQTMSAGGMGGGVSAAVARALGAGRQRDANALVLHALVIDQAPSGVRIEGDQEVDVTRWTKIRAQQRAEHSQSGNLPALSPVGESMAIDGDRKVH